MRVYDAVIIGAGLTGVFCARNLARYDLSVAVLEKNEDVCTGISKANTGIIYTGYDNKPGSLKSRLCVQANGDFDRLCRDLSVRFQRPGSLMISYGPHADRVLRKKYEDGKAGGVRHLELLSGAEVSAMEPNLQRGVTLGLWARDTGTVNPWELGIAAYENARQNGVDFRFREEVRSLSRIPGGFLIETEKETVRASVVINAAGLQSAVVRELLEKPSVRIFPTAADYIVLDRSLKGFVEHIIFHEGEEGKGLTIVPTVDGNLMEGKGLTIVPTVDGNLMVGPTTRELTAEEKRLFDRRVTLTGLAELHRLCREVVPGLDLEKQIRSFGALRPNPYQVHEENGRFVKEEKSIRGFLLEEKEGFFSLIGIKTPGLTFSNELGKVTAEKAAAFLGKEKALRRDYDPVRKAPVRVSALEPSERAALIARDPAYGTVVCRCMDVTEGEIRDALLRCPLGSEEVILKGEEFSGRLFEQLKRRTGVGMGPCQGARCTGRILQTAEHRSE